MQEAHRSHRHHRDAALGDDERVLVGAVGAAAELHHAQHPRGDVVHELHVERDDAVGDVLLEALPGQGPFALLSGEDDGDALLLQPAQEPPQLRPQDGQVHQSREERFDGVEQHPLGTDGVDGVLEPDEEAVEVVLARLLDLVPLHRHELEHQLLLGDQPVEVEAERADVGGQLFRRFLEGDEDAGLATAPRTRNSRPRTVLPHPARPLTSVGRPRGRPPCVSSSSPAIPVGAFDRLCVRRDLRALFALSASGLGGSILPVDLRRPDDGYRSRRRQHPTVHK